MGNVCGQLFHTKSKDGRVKQHNTIFIKGKVFLIWQIVTCILYKQKGVLFQTQGVNFTLDYFDLEDSGNCHYDNLLVLGANSQVSIFFVHYYFFGLLIKVCIFCLAPSHLVVNCTRDSIYTHESDFL